MRKNVVMLRSNPVRPYPRLEKMANVISSLGYNVTVLAWDRQNSYGPKADRLHLQNKDITIIRVGIKGEFSGGFKKNALGLARFECFLYKWLSKHKKEYDIIHAYDFDCGYIASIIAHMYKKTLVYDIADYYVDSHRLKGTLIGNLVEKKEIGVIDKADVTILCTEERIKQIERAHPNRVVYIHNTPNLDQFGYETNCIIDNPTDRIKLVYVGILGLDRFIENIAKVVSKRDDCEFHIGGYGNGLESLFENYAREFDNIYYYGTLQYEQTIKLERECDVLCAMYDPEVPNHRYAAPNKFYEALAIGKPLIMVKDTGMASIVEREGIGEVIEYNTDALNKAINHLITIRETWPQIAEKEHLLYSQLYSWKEMERRIIKLYSSI